MGSRVCPPKKGAPDSGLGRFRALASRFVEFCRVYSPYFDVYSNNVVDQARCYLAGLMMKAPRKNMERMEEYVADCEYQSTQQFLTDSPWDDAVLQKRIAQDVNAELGGPDSALCLDESGFSKKGTTSVGVARQYNGRLGKIDNCQVGVFASLVRGSHGSIIDKRLFLPDEWARDEQRCARAGVPPEKRVHRTKQRLAMDMVDAALAAGVQFGYVCADAAYGNVPWFARELQGRGLKFVLDVQMNQRFYVSEPHLYLPRRKSARGRKHTKLKTHGTTISVKELIDQIGKDAWQSVEVRDSTKGTLSLRAWRARVYLWDRREKRAQHWWLVITKNPVDGDIKASVSNFDEDASLEQLVRARAQRFWIERCFQDAKTSLGMAQYQARMWNSWHHHMCLVSLAMLFMLRERLHHNEPDQLLSCQDIVELLDHYLPRADVTEEAVVRNMERRHRKRLASIQSAHRRRATRVNDAP